MTFPQPNVRRSGKGPYVLCLHASTSSSKQWQSLMDKLSDQFTVLAPDLYGYGQSPEWNEDRPMELDDEIELLKPVLDSIPGPFHLVGHSFGAAISFKLALMMPERLRSLVAYEPILFNLLAEVGEEDASTEVWMVSNDVRRLVGEDRFSDAGRRFIDYWSGVGSWDQLPEWQQESIKRRMNKVRSDFDATLGNPTPLEAYSKLAVPCLFLYGLQSPESTRRIAEWLSSRLPQAEVRGLLPLGHMGPITHADQVNNLIASFLTKQPKGLLVHQIKTR